MEGTTEGWRGRDEGGRVEGGRSEGGGGGRERAQGWKTSVYLSSLLKVFLRAVTHCSLPNW